MLKFVSKILLTSFVCNLLLISQTNAQTAQQIQQFKNLPKAKQEQLARQLGIDLSQYSMSSKSDKFEYENTSVYPRETNFDELGNPSVEIDTPIDNDKSDSELVLYGKDLFANGPSSFTSISNLPIPQGYVVGPGDHISIQIFGKENEEHNLVVGRDGKIVLPKLGPISVAYTPFSMLRQNLTEKITQQIIGVDVNIQLTELRSIQVFVMGEAYKPGTYNVSALSTITHAIFASGGVTDIASLRNIQLKRAGEVVTTLDIYDLLNKGDTRNDVALQAGDVVFIPTVKQTISIDGVVRRPAIYELKGKESLAEALALAGGSLANGYQNAISIKRFKRGKKIQLTIDLESEQIQVENGDEIVVPEVSEYVADSITLIGDVARPGKYQWNTSLTVHSLLGDIQREVLETADLNYILVLREDSKTNELDVYQADLTIPTSQGDVQLKANDKVLVFSRMESQLLGDVTLEQLAFTADKLKEQEEQIWQQRISEKLFWQSVGVLDEQGQRFNNTETQDLQSQSIIQLTEAEKEKVLEYKDSTYFSRKRMLSPVIARLKEQARYGSPLKLIEVAGEVKVPGIYPLTNNASIQNLIKAAGGLTEAAYPEKSEITRTEINENGDAVVRHIEFKPFDELNNGSEEVKTQLKSKDRINIFSTPSWQEELTVTVKGEVEFPGSYTIRRGETLNELLTRVGGLTEYGDANSVVFTRETLKEQERVNLRNLAEELRKQIASESLRRQSGAGSIVSYDEARKLLRDLTEKEAVGRLVIDLAALIEGDDNNNVILEDGDVLYVPGRSQSVNVLGEVYVPTSHLFKAGQGFESYIETSGGYRALADVERVYVIRANGAVYIPNQAGSFWFGSEQNDTKIMPGDTIVVPFDSDNIDNMTLWANATQIIYQLAVAVAAISSL